MTQTIDLESWFRDTRSVAALLPAEKLFGLLRRSLDLPAAYAALARRDDGASTVTAPGGKVNGDGISELLLVRTTPLDLEFHVEKLSAKDKYLCDARVTLSVRALPDRTELNALRDRILGSRSTIDVAQLESHLQSDIENALSDTAMQRDADDLLAPAGATAAAEAVIAALEPRCFESGLTLDSRPSVRFTSPAFEKTRKAEQRAARDLDEHEAQHELRDALAQAQRARVDHLEEMLARLKTLADQSPDVELPELMRAFDEAQRSQLYQALFASRATQRVTESIAVVAGSEVLFFDGGEPAEITRRVVLDTPVGALRSIQRDPESGDLMIGAASGVCLLQPEADAPHAVFQAPNWENVRGGFNAVARRGDDLVATHSELGIIHWRLHEPNDGKPLLTDLTDVASAVRNAMFDGDRFWCTIDSTAITLAAEALHAPPMKLDAGSVTLSALRADGDTVYAGTSDGDLLLWTHWLDGGPSARPQRLHGGSRRPVETITCISVGGIPRVFFTDTSLAVHCRVLGDSFACRFEAGGQTIRRAECAGDIIVGTLDARDRAVVWKSDEPARPAFVLNVNRLTGRSIQDVCLIPFALKA